MIITQQKAVLEKKSARKIITKVQKDSASLIVHRGDSSSLLSRITDTGSRLSVKFAFDRKLWATDVYSKYAQRAMKNEIRSRQEGHPSLNPRLPEGRTAGEVMAPLHPPGERRNAISDDNGSIKLNDTTDQTSSNSTEGALGLHRQIYTIRLQGSLNQSYKPQLLEYFKTAPQLKEYPIKAE